jgi:hypothetical protein
MSKSKILFLLLLTITPITVFGQESLSMRKIKTIELLKSTRKDVVTTFGEPLEKDVVSDAKYYDLVDGRMRVAYAVGTCDYGTDGLAKSRGWNVPEWTVISITFTPKERISPESVSVDFAGFEKEIIHDVPGGVAYHNDMLGIHYTVYKGKIETIMYYPPNETKIFRCK